MPVTYPFHPGKDRGLPKRYLELHHQRLRELRVLVGENLQESVPPELTHMLNEGMRGE